MRASHQALPLAVEAALRRLVGRAADARGAFGPLAGQAAFHVERLRARGWLVPAYPLPESLTAVTVQRAVVRNGLSRDLAGGLVDAISDGVAMLDRLDAPLPGPKAVPFHH